MRIETIGDATLYLGDCREILPTLPNPDAVVTDPPYGMSYNTDSTRFTGRFEAPGRNDRQCLGDNKPFDPSPWLAVDKVIMWGANHYAQRLPKGSTLVWIKRYPQHYGQRLSDAEIGWQKGGEGVYCLNAPDSTGRRAAEFTGTPLGGTAHVFQKPIELMRWCIERLNLPAGGLILDPYMGSGTTGLAAISMGYRFIGIELDPDYFKIACRRFDDAVKRPALAI